MAIITTENVKALQEISNILPHSYLQKQRLKKWQKLLKPTLAVLWNKNLILSGLLLSPFFKTWENIPALIMGFLGKIKGKASGRVLLFEVERKM